MDIGEPRDDEVREDRPVAAPDHYLDLVGAAAQLLGVETLALAASQYAFGHFRSLQADFARHAERVLLPQD